MQFLLLRAIALVLCLAITGPLIAQPVVASAERAANLTAEQWREDLAFMVTEMKRRHPNLYHSVPRADFEAAVADLNRHIPQMRRNEIIVGMMRLAAMIGDGHTRIDPRKDAKFGFPSLPLKLYQFEDGMFVRAARPDYRALVGAEIIEIGGVPIAEATKRTQAISSVDNAMGYRLFAPLYLAMPDILHALKLSGSPGSATLKLRKGGRTWTATVPAGQVDPLWPPDTDISLVTPVGWIDARTTPSLPLWLQEPLRYHRLSELREQRALYVQVNMITGFEGQSLAQFAERIRRTAETFNPKALILDFRLSYGGNHELRHRFIREMVKAEDQDTRLFVLTWRGAFSATEAFLVDLDRLTDAVFIGEPASSKPNSYGDAYRTALPNSGISIRTSIQFNQLKGQSTDPWTWVDLATGYRFADYVAGRDPALEAALAYEPVPNLLHRLKQVSSPGEAKTVIETYAADPRNRFANIERQLLGAAETIAAGKANAVALAAARAASERFPDSHDSQLVHALLLDRAGETRAATDAARRAIAIDPNSRQARSLLERLNKRS